MIKKLLGALAILLLLFGCGGDEGMDFGDIDPAYNIDFSDIEISEEALECAAKEQNIQNEYSIMIEEAWELYYLELEQIDDVYIELGDDYFMRIDQLKVSFESEGGDLDALEEKLIVLEEEMWVKINELINTADTESQEYREATRLLYSEMIKGMVKLFSAGGVETEELASQFFDWFKEYKKKLDENEDKWIELSQKLDIEVQRLVTESDAAVKALNCG